MRGRVVGQRNVEETLTCIIAWERSHNKSL
jgi:hypothetical protein